MLEFVGDAIVLSGETGTKLKTAIIGDYYEFWWGITLGGKRSNYMLPTAIIDLYAATGEIFIRETKETILGSAGHALNLKSNRKEDTQNLSIVIVEENLECFNHLKNVLKRRFRINIEEISQYINGVSVLNYPKDEVLEEVSKRDFGNTLFLFDPLLFEKWESINKVASRRLKKPFQSGTEFIIFLFTSDWVNGRKNVIYPLPTSLRNGSMSNEDLDAIQKANVCMGDEEWQKDVFSTSDNNKRQELFLEQYVARLHRWFKHVIPLPFCPKKDQLFHLIFCSNYSVGNRGIQGVYKKYTRKSISDPLNEGIYQYFKTKYSNTFNFEGNRRPLEWKLLWEIICVLAPDDGGFIEEGCFEFERKLNADKQKIDQAFEWLMKEGFIVKTKPLNWMWSNEEIMDIYRLNHERIRIVLNLNFSKFDLIPLQPQGESSQLIEYF